MIEFFILIFIMIGIWYTILNIGDTSEISNNWSKYRCDPTIMIFASFYGHDMLENFNFCLKQSMSSETGSVLSPIFQIVGTLLGSISNLINVANSMRLEFATFMGGINTVFQNFTDRFTQLTQNIKMTAQHMKMLMGRLYATFFALMYMSVSGISATQNFGNTVLFKFIDTFCFDPDTVVILDNNKKTKVSDVNIGDVFKKTGSRVTSKFWFNAIGQPMVDINNIIVSTNHYVKVNNKYVQALYHPDAKIIKDWSGEPLICFNTDDNIIPINNEIFLDYDETENGDEKTMKWVEKNLNGVESNDLDFKIPYTTVLNPLIYIKMHNGSLKLLRDIKLGDRLKNGIVIGIVEKEIDKICLLNNDELVTPGSLIWYKPTSSWKRVGELKPIIHLSTQEIYKTVFLESANIETKSGTIFRDYMEIYSPDTEQFYSNEIEKYTGIMV